MPANLQNCFYRVTRKVSKLLATLFLSQVFSIACFAQPTSGNADLVAPKIEVKPKLEAAPNTELVLSATVTDDRGVEKVILYYKTAGSQEYKKLPMSQGGTGNVYFATLPQKDVQKPSVEYYIQASDLAGNSVLFGYNFSPKTIRVLDTVAASNSEINLSSFDNKPGNSKEKKSGSMKWLWIGLGAIAVGAVAGSGGGGSTSTGNGAGVGGPGPGDEDTGDVTIVAPIP